MSLDTGALGLGSGWFDPILPVRARTRARRMIAMHCSLMRQQVSLFTDKAFTLLMEAKDE
jgi:hypothetical protein